MADDFAGVTPQLCREAYAMIETALAKPLESPDSAQDSPDSTQDVWAQRKGHLVVLDPRHPYCEDLESSFAQDVVLWSTPVGESTPGLAEVSVAKAFVTWKTGVASHVVQQLAPYLYEQGWTKWAGSAIAPGGLVTAFSGIRGYYDQMVAEWMLSAIKGLCMERMGGVLSDPTVDLVGVR